MKQFDTRLHGSFLQLASDIFQHLLPRDFQHPAGSDPVSLDQRRLHVVRVEIEEYLSHPDVGLVGRGRDLHNKFRFEV